MKKFFTLIAGLLMIGSANAAVLVDDVTENAEYTYPGSWGGNWFNQGGDAMNKDVSEYDYIWIQYENMSGKIGFGIIYSEWQKTESWGEVYYTDSKVIESMSGVVGIPLEKTKTYEFGVNKVDNEFKGDIYAKHVRQVYLQDQGTASAIKVVGIWYGTEAEYQAALEGNKPVVAPKKQLDLTNLGSGWGNSEYDVATKTITIGDDWSGKGWWLATWDGTGNVGTDYSAYDKFAIEFAEPTELNGKVNIEYDGGIAASSAEFEAGSTVVVVDMDPEGKSKVMQIYLQGPAGTKYVLADAYFCTNEAAPVVPQNNTQVLFSWEGSADGAIVTGGTAVGNGADEANVNKKNKDYYTLCVSSKKANIDTDNITITLDEPLAEGDKIDVTAYKNKDTAGKIVTLYLAYENGDPFFNDEETWVNIYDTDGVDIDEDGNTPNTNSYTVAAGNAGSKVIRLARSKASTNLFIIKFVISRAGAADAIDDVKTIVIDNGAVYNLRGQRVDDSYKGIVIRNGKKLLQK
ncbi:MAG: hypothetical protein K5683_06680 [Prevotella sp.]|nr:hypothetical protein [Prevotella sp.]